MMLIAWAGRCVEKKVVFFFPAFSSQEATAPLGILAVSTPLLNAGDQVKIIDSTITPNFQRQVIEELKDAICLAVSLVTGPMIRETVQIAREVKRLYPKMLALEAILRAVPLEQVPGLYFRAGDGSAVHTGPARFLADLDAQPWPDRERIDIDQYLRVWCEHHGAGSVSVITARGCPYHCRWCSHSTFGKTHRRRSAASVVDEVEWILNRYHPEQLWFADDVFTIHHGWLDAYSAEMRRRGWHIPFECITRADRLNARVAAQLAELGCDRVWIGSESGSQRMLDAMERGVTVAQVRAAVGQLKQNGIRTGMFFMWGYEGEELSDIEATYEQVKACQPDVFFTTISYPIKGTPYYDEVAPKLVQLGPWQATTDRDIKIRGRRSRRFYQLPDQLLRSETPAEAAQVRQRLEDAYSEVEA